MDDLPCSHSTSDRALRSGLADFSAHPDLSPVTVNLLRQRYDVYLHAGDNGRATRLARVSTGVALSRIAAELNKRSKNGYLHPTCCAVIWRNPHARRKLRRLLRDDPERELFLAEFQLAAHDERWLRAHQLAVLAIEQVELAARSLRPEEVDHRIDHDRQRAENLRRAEVGVLAWLLEKRAAQLARDHERDFRTEDEREDAMIGAAVGRMFWHFKMRGDRLVARLVGEALGREIKPRRVSYLATGR